MHTTTTCTLLYLLVAHDEEAIKTARETEKEAKARLVEIQHNMKV